MERIDDFNCLASKQKCQSSIIAIGSISGNFQFMQPFASALLLNYIWNNCVVYSTIFRQDIITGF